MSKWFTMVWFDTDEMNVVNKGLFGPFTTDATREITIEAVYEDIAEDEAGVGLVLGIVRFDVDGEHEPTLREGEGLLGFRKWENSWKD